MYGPDHNQRGVTMPIQWNDWALTHDEQVTAGAIDTFPPHILQRMPAYPRSQGDNRDEAGEEAARQEEETATILNECESLAEVESEWWER